MKFKFNILSIATAALLGAGLSSCNDWLKVDMEDQVLESTLFSDYKGYRTALNGVYQSMIPHYTTLFGPQIDVMGQVYNVSNVNNHTYLKWAQYDFANLESENSQIWNSFYNLLANVNIIIEHTQDSDCPLNANQYGLMRGEALGLRGMLHLDLLRLYGPVFSISDQLECMPYQASSKREILPFLKGAEVIELVIKDLNEAAELLKEADPIITEGAKLESIVDDGVSFYDSSFRQFRMNYYAVQALRARAYLWKGDKTKAYEIATKDIIDAITTEDLTVFPWSTKAQVQANGKPDLVFSTEVFFSLYHSIRDRNYNSSFYAGTLEKNRRLTFPGEDLTSSKVEAIYESGDLRRDMWQVVDPTSQEKSEYEQAGGAAPNTLALVKYAPFDRDVSTSGTEYYQYMVPLIRLGEVYMIAAECAPSNAEAREFINTLRLHRNLPDLDPSKDLSDAIFREMFRETLAESQIFFFYKRQAAASMISGTAADGSYIEVAPSSYVMPTPLDELAQRENNGESNEK